MRRIVFLVLFLIPLLVKAGDDSGFEERLVDKSISYVRPDGSAWASLQIMEPELTLSTTKAYAQYVMDSYQGWDLKPVIDLRGFSFKYVDNAPCAGLVTYFDGRSYLFFKACGSIEENELKDLFLKGGEKLKLQEILKKQAKPSVY
ncbi:MAG: hypothetical protein J6M93_01420 [Succinivibrio sp.]|nr:hypothetical protein [Succinivibrio sp.]